VLHRIFADIDIATRGQPTKDNGKQQDEQDPQEETRDRHPTHREHHQRAVEQRIGAHRCKDARRHRQHHRERQSIQCQETGRFSPLQQRLGHWLPNEERLAKIEPERVAKPVHELHRHRLIQAKPLAQRLFLFLGRFPAQHDRGWIARRQVHQRKHNDADQQQYRNQQQQSPDDICKHSLTRLGR
jgi:hypothetical protein